MPCFQPFQVYQSTMPKIFSAPSLFHALNDDSCDFAPRQSELYCLPVASLNNPEPKKRVSEMMKEALVGTGFIIWHDAINNNLSKHPSNYNLPLEPVDSLEKIFDLESENNVIAFAYVKRQRV